MRARSLVVAIALAAMSVGKGLADEPNRNRFSVDIQPQPLHAALQEFARQTGLQVLRRDEDISVEGIIAPRVQGKLSAQEALDRLLSQTSLSYEWINEHTVRVIPSHTTTATTSFRPGDVSRVQWFSQTRLASESSSIEPQTPQPARASEREDSIDRAQQRGDLQEIVVTAQKREERLRDVPISISVLRGEDLDKSPVTGITEALNRVPGVATTVAWQGGGTQVAMRGVTAGGPLFNGSSPIAYYLDSVPFGLIKTAIAPDSNAYDLERVEVLRGPQGTLYGAGGEGGVVRVLTRDASLEGFDWKARIADSRTKGGSNNYRADTAFNVPIVEGKLAARAVVGYENLSGWIDSPNRQDVNDAELRNYRIKVNAQPTEELSIGLSGWSSRNNYGAPSTSQEDGRITASTNQPMSTDFDVYGLKVGYEFAHFSASINSSHLQFTNVGSQDLFPFFGISLPFLTELDSRVFSQEILLQSAQRNVWKWSAGAFYRDAKDRLIQDIPAIFHPDLSDTSKSYAAFGQFGRRFRNEKLEWAVGLRYFHDDVSNRNNTLNQSVDKSFTATTPRVVLTWYPNNEVTTYASYSQGFRSGFPQNVGFVPPEFPSLRPDKLHNLEVGAKADMLGGQVSFDSALYYIDWRDVQQTLTVPHNGVPVTALVNGISASGIGFDLGLTFRPAAGLALGLNGSWSDLKMDSDVFSEGVLLFAKGDRLNLSPEYTAGAFSDYVFPLGASGLNARLSASANYSSSQAQRTITTGVKVVQVGDPIFTARAGFSIVSPNRWTAGVFVENLTDEDGSPARNLAVVTDWDLRVRPRTIGVQLDYNFGGP